MADNIIIRYTDGDTDRYENVTHVDSGVAIYIFDASKNAEFRIPYANTYGVIIMEAEK